MLDAAKANALSLLQRGQTAAAEVTIRGVLATHPNDPAALTIAAIIDTQRGRDAEAESKLINALEHDPGHVEGLIVYSKLLVKQRRFEEALTCAEAAVLAQPEDPGLLIHLGLMLLRFQRLPDAKSVFSRAVEIDPTNPEAAQNYACALRDSGETSAAIDAFYRLVELSPRNLVGWQNLAKLLLARERFPETLAAAERAIELNRLDAASNWLMALALAEVQRGDEAEPYLRRAVKLNPADGLARAALGYWLQEQGQFEKSLTLLEDAVRKAPDHGFAYYNLFRAKKATLVDPELIEDLRQRSENLALPDRDLTDMNYALGKAYEDLQQFEASMHHYDAANRMAYKVWLGEQAWERENYAARFGRTMETFTADKLAELSQSGSDSELPLMIVGMMRSGTSLLEQILSSHPDVIGAGELPFWHDHEDEAFDEGHVPNPLKIRELGDRYLADLQKLGPNAKRVTDKLPHNYAMLGLIHTAFPKTKIIHVRRSPIDNCLSIYTTAYQRPPVFAHDKSNIMFAYRQYQRIIAHWREVLPPEQFMEVQYEEIVADRDNQTRRLIEFSGLPWDDACLHHEKNERAVRTPSLWQVRQPIYKTSVERWRKFEPWIGEFRDLLPTA